MVDKRFSNKKARWSGSVFSVDLLNCSVELLTVEILETGAAKDQISESNRSNNQNTNSDSQTILTQISVLWFSLKGTREVLRLCLWSCGHFCEIQNHLLSQRNWLISLKLYFILSSCHSSNTIMSLKKCWNIWCYKLELNNFNVSLFYLLSIITLLQWSNTYFEDSFSADVPAAPLLPKHLDC